VVDSKDYQVELARGLFLAWEVAQSEISAASENAI